MILTAFQRLSEISEDLFRPALSRMEPATKEYLSDARDDKKARGVLMGRDLLKRLGAEYFGCGPEQIVLGHDTHGRPYLLEAQPDTVRVCDSKLQSDTALVRDPTADGISRVLIPPGFCSLSHSRAYILAVVSDEAYVGCDTERLRNHDYPIRALTGFFSGHDLTGLSHISDPGLRRLELTRLWTRKEAVFKLTGKADSRSLHLSDEITMQNTYGITFLEKVMEECEVLTVAVKSADGA